MPDTDLPGIQAESHVKRKNIGNLSKLLNEDKMLIDLLVANSWLAAVLWALLYVSDHALTRLTVKLYQAFPKERQVISYQAGIMELNPAAEQEVKRQQWFSRRFIFMLVVVVSSILLIGLLNEKTFFEIYIGVFILEWIFINLTHLQNLAAFRDLRKPSSATGQIKYSYWISQRTSAYHLLSFVILYLFVALASSRSFFVGGAIGCSILALRQFSLANRKFPPSADVNGEIPADNIPQPDDIHPVQAPPETPAPTTITPSKNRRKTSLLIGGSLLAGVCLCAVLCAVTIAMNLHTTSTEQAQFEPREHFISTEDFDVKIEQAYWEQQKVRQLVNLSPIIPNVLGKEALVLDLEITNRLTRTTSLICYVQDNVGHQFSDSPMYSSRSFLTLIFDARETRQGLLAFDSLPNIDQELWFHCGVCNHACVAGKVPTVALQLR
jgi:hypothetical protein